MEGSQETDSKLEQLQSQLKAIALERDELRRQLEQMSVTVEENRQRYMWNSMDVVCTNFSCEYVFLGRTVWQRTKLKNLSLMN